MTPPAAAGARSPLTWYYLATPVFVVMDLGWGVNVRISALDDTPALKFGYYALCLALGGVTTLRPNMSAAVGLAESSVNVVLLIVGFWATYFRILLAIADGKDMTNHPFTPAWFVNFGLSAIVFVTAFYGSQAALARRRRSTI